MINKRFAIASCAVFLFFFFFDAALHRHALADLYAYTANLWREPATGTWVLIGQILMAVMFCHIFLKNFEDKGLKEGARYGLLIGLLLAGPEMVSYGVQPVPADFPVVLIIGNIIEMVVAGVIVSAIYAAMTESAASAPAAASDPSPGG